MKRFWTVLACLLGLSEARGEPIVFRLSGVVSEVTDPGQLLPPSIAAGTAFTGQLFYETSTPDEFPTDPARGRYRHLPNTGQGGLSIVIGDLDFHSVTDNDFHVEIDNGLTYIPFDDPGATRPAADYFWVPDVYVNSGLPVEQVKFQLLWSDQTAAAFQSDFLPLELDVSSFENPSIDIVGTGGAETGGGGVAFLQIRVAVESAVVVPEPSTALVGALALGICGVATRSRLKHVD